MIRLGRRKWPSARRVGELGACSEKVCGKNRDGPGVEH